MLDNIAIVGDFHYDAAVTSRIDNYSETCIKKLKEIANRHKVIIFLGDFFNKPVLSFDALIPLYKCLQEVQESGCRVLTIMGNHDIFNEREDSLNRTALGWFSTVGAIEIIQPGEVVSFTLANGYTLNFHALYVSIEKSKEFLDSLCFKRQPMEKNIILSHNYFESTYAGFKILDFNHCDADYVFFGHEHEPLAENLKNAYGTCFYRCGSLMRNAANDYNLVRMPKYDVISTADDGIVIARHKVEVASSPVDIFKTQSFQRSNLEIDHFTEAVRTGLDQIVEMYDNVENPQRGELITIPMALSRINAPSYVVNIIKAKYEMLGEKF